MNDYVTKLQGCLHGRILAAIDGANLEQSVRRLYVHPRDIPESFRGHDPETLAWSVAYRALHRFFIEYSHPLTDVIFYTARFNTKGHDEFLTVLKRTGFKLRTKPLKEYADHHPDHPHRKANFDVELSIDVVERLSTFDVLVLFSGDSDFAALLQRVRERGKRTVLISRKGHVAKELFPVTDQYFDIIDLRSALLRIGLRKRQEPRPRAGFGG